MTESNTVSRVLDLAQRCYEKGIYTYTGFLSADELSEVMGASKQFSHVPYEFFGGYEDAERCMLRFGNEEFLGYAEEHPIDILKIKPINRKFSQELTHRDFLGALMNLGIERDVLGDIIVNDSEAYIFVRNSISEYIKENLSGVKHTTVTVENVGELPAVALKEPVRTKIMISSERIDAVVAKIYGFSREKSIGLFRERKVFLNGKICENNSAQVKAGDRITVRGFGKFVYIGATGMSKKGKINAEADVY